MERRSPIPRPWWQVGLAVLPGLVGLLGQVLVMSDPVNTIVRYAALGTVVLLTVSSIVVAASRRSPLKVPIWGLVPLGLLAGFGSIWTIEYLGFYPTCLLLIVVGLLFAWHNGASAALFVVTSGMLATSWAVEPSMYFWDSPFWREVINTGMTVLFTVVVPILVLRSPSVLGQAAGLLVPVAAYYAAFVYGMYAVRGISVSQSLSVRNPFVVWWATIAVAVVLYHLISSRARSAGGVPTRAPSG